MTRCRFCAGDIQDAALVCRHCGKDQRSGASPAGATTPSPTMPMTIPAVVDSAAAATGPVPLLVSVVDVDMPFMSMVGFMVKWALAAVPALLLLAVLAAIIAAVFSAGRLL